MSGIPLRLDEGRRRSAAATPIVVQAFRYGNAQEWLRINLFILDAPGYAAKRDG